MSPLSIESMQPQMEERLAKLEDDVRAGLHAFVRVGKALREIRDQHLYRVHYDSFGDYCAHRWEMSRAYAYRLIDASDIAEAVSTIGDNVQGPRHESHCRALAPLKDRREVMVSVWTTLRQEHGDELTAEVVHNAVRARLSRLEEGRPGGPPAEPESPPADAPASGNGVWADSTPPTTAGHRPLVASVASGEAAITVHATMGDEQARSILNWIDATGFELNAAMADLRQQIEIQLNALT